MESPTLAPVVSLEHGLRRLRELGWEWPAYPDWTTFRRMFSYLMAVPFIVLSVVVALSIPLRGSIFCCLAVVVGIFWLVLAVFTFQVRRFTRLTHGMARRPLNPAAGGDIFDAIEKECIPLGGWASKDMRMGGFSPLALDLTSTNHVAYRLPQLGASLVVGLRGAQSGIGRPYVLFIGPVTGENVGGIVRLAEALDRHPAVGSARLRG